ncbi:hypothetical protein RclHR1_01960037 [Rhizophagus clarus]|uniref:RRM domain-containing protein n=1 Tax=Rhizophagus clarus TaxID=94130 RepID=A0A2Z6QPW5_9GLOM|nr:hypothetical protein RclHR1_01960037 [Rhizophagus clarus]
MRRHSDGESAAQQKCTRTFSDNTMDEDFVTTAMADVRVDSPSSPPKENNTALTSIFSPPNNATASSAPCNDASDGLNVSMHARTMTSASPPNANDYQAAAAPNSAPDTLKNFPTNKALIEAVNNTFLEMYELYTGKARMTGSGDAKRLVIHFHTAEIRDACVGAAHQQFPDLVFHAHDPRQLQIDQKSSHHAFIATLTQLPPNTKDIDLAPLIRELGAKAVNVLLSLNSYQPKKWVYVTFPSHELMDAAMEQIIGFHGHILQWNLPDNINKLCHRCGKLGCAPNQCPLRQFWGRTWDRNPVAALKERFRISQPTRSNANTRSRSRSCSRSKGPDTSQTSQRSQSSSGQSKGNNLNNTSQHNCSKSNNKRDRSVFFSSVLCTPPLS